MRVWDAGVHVVYMVVVEVVVLCGVLVLLACCFAYWRMASPLSAGCLPEVPIRDASAPISVMIPVYT